jgi:hypothetical protein
MVEQLTGAAIAAVIVLCYLLILQTMTAAVVLLAQFIVVQVRALWSLVEWTPTPGEPSRPPVPLVDDQGEPYRLGGGLARW